MKSFLAALLATSLLSCGGSSPAGDQASSPASDAASSLSRDEVIDVGGVAVLVGRHDASEPAEQAAAAGRLSVGPGGCLLIVDGDDDRGLVPVFPMGTTAAVMDGSVVVSFPPGAQVTVGTQVSLTGSVVLWDAADGLLGDCAGAGAGAFEVQAP